MTWCSPRATRGGSVRTGGGHEAPPPSRLPRATPLGDAGEDAGDGVLLDPLVHGRREGMRLDIEVRSSGPGLRLRNFAGERGGYALYADDVPLRLSAFVRNAARAFPRDGVAIIIRRAS